MRRARFAGAPLVVATTLAACSPFSSDLTIERVEPPEGLRTERVEVTLVGAYPGWIRSSVNSGETDRLPLSAVIRDAAGIEYAPEAIDQTRDGAVELVLPPLSSAGLVTIDVTLGSGDQARTASATDKYRAIEAQVGGGDAGGPTPTCPTPRSCTMPGVAGCGDSTTPASRLVPGNLSGPDFFLSADEGPTTSYCDDCVAVSGCKPYDLQPCAPNVPETHAHPARVTDFCLDTYEVSVDRFRAFVHAGMGTQISPPVAGDGARTLNGMPNQGGWDAAWNAQLPSSTMQLERLLTGLSVQPPLLACPSSGFTFLSTWAPQPSWLTDPALVPKLPINCVNWYLAFAFCVWDGGFLPTEAEWNYAAAGGDEQRTYPWSTAQAPEAIEATQANYACAGRASGATTEDCSPLTTPWRVGQASGLGRFGHADLAGNLFELTLDRYVPSYGAGQASTTCTDCAVLGGLGQDRVVRGGTYGDSGKETAVRTSTRGGHSDARPFMWTGVRCARRPAP